MANCNYLFQNFGKEVSLTKTKIKRIKTSRDGLREHIRKYFKIHHPEYIPYFYIQGSFKMKTSIRTKDDICDLDDGVYFFRTPDVTATTLQSWVKDAIEDYTSTVPEHRKKCIRIIFTNDYEIDLPIYYQVDDIEYQLAVKAKDWEPSDPKAMVDWFNKKKDKKGQLVRIVKYLKAWCDDRTVKMPSGLAMTILASNAFTSIAINDRDDIILRDILKEIQKALNSDFKCKVPAVPFDNLFENYDSGRKRTFLDALDDFLQDAESALREKNELKASKLWRKHLGNRFPLGEDKDEDTSKYSSIILGAKASNPWSSL